MMTEHQRERKITYRLPVPTRILIHRCMFCSHKFVRHGVLLPLSDACDDCRIKVLAEAKKPKLEGKK